MLEPTLSDAYRWRHEPMASFLAVFMQPDKHAQNAGDLQNFNRYGYCLNNPLTCTDPTGMTYMRPGALSAASRMGSLMVVPAAAQKFAAATAADTSGTGAKQLTQGSNLQAVNGFNNPEEAIKWTVANCSTMAPEECAGRLNAYFGWIDARAMGGRAFADGEAALQANDAKMAAMNQLAYQGFQALAILKVQDKERALLKAMQEALAPMVAVAGGTKNESAQVLLTDVVRLTTPSGIRFNIMAGVDARVVSALFENDAMVPGLVR